MRFAKPLLSASAALALIATGAGAAENADEQSQGKQDSGQVVQSCVDRLSEMNEKYRGQSEGLSQREMRNLFNAASILANNGQRDACMAVIEGIAAVASASGEPAEGDSQERAADRDVKQAFATAEPIGKTQAFATQAYLDNTVVGPSGEVLADVEEIVSTESATYLVLGSGGFLDIGDEHRPVRMDRFVRIDEDTLGLRMTEDKFESAPTFKQAEIATGETGWVQQVESWWQSNAVQPAPSAKSRNAAAGNRPQSGSGERSGQTGSE